VRQGGSTNNPTKTYDVVTTSALQILMSNAINAPWKARVQGQASRSGNVAGVSVEVQFLEGTPPEGGVSG